MEMMLEAHQISTEDSLLSSDSQHPQLILSHAF